MHGSEEREGKWCAAPNDVASSGALVAHLTKMSAQRLAILHINDFYELEPRNTEPIGGPTHASALISSLRERSESDGVPALVLFSGDCLNPSMLSTVTRGRQMISVLNQLKVDAACLGNHDLDFGLGTFEEVAQQCTFPWLVSNCVDLSTGQPLGHCKSFHVIDVPGFGRVGLVGLIEEAWLATLATIDPSAVEYRDFVAVGNELAQELRTLHNVDVMIALTHMRVPNDLEFVAKAVGFDLVLGGHDHEYVHELGQAHGKPALVKSGTELRWVSEVTLAKEPVQAPAYPTNEPSTPTFLGCRASPTANGWHVGLTRHEVRSSLPQDPLMADIVRGFAEVLGKKLQQIVGLSRVPLDATFKSLRTQETNAGNWVADLMRQGTGAEVAILNSGTLRADAVLGPGIMRMRDLVSLLPMQDTVVTLRMPGDLLLAALENAVCMWPAREGRFAQVSGVHFTADASAPPGKRVVRGSVFVLHKVQASPRLHIVHGGASPGRAGHARTGPATSTKPALTSVLFSADEAEVDEAATPVTEEPEAFSTGPIGGAAAAPVTPRMSRNISAPAHIDAVLSSGSINSWKISALHLPSAHKAQLGGVVDRDHGPVSDDEGHPSTRGSVDAANTHRTTAHGHSDTHVVQGVHAAILRTNSNPVLIGRGGHHGHGSGGLAAVPFASHGGADGDGAAGHAKGLADLPEPPEGYVWGPLDTTRDYIVATKHYLAKGKDGYDCMADPRVTMLVDDETGPVLPSLVRNHLRILSSMSGYASWQPPSSTPGAGATPVRLAPARGSIRRVPSMLVPHHEASPGSASQHSQEHGQEDAGFSLGMSLSPGNAVTEEWGFARRLAAVSLSPQPALQASTAGQVASGQGHDLAGSRHRASLPALPEGGSEEEGKSTPSDTPSQSAVASAAAGPGALHVLPMPVGDVALPTSPDRPSAGRGASQDDMRTPVRPVRETIGSAGAASMPAGPAVSRTAGTGVGGASGASFSADAVRTKAMSGGHAEDGKEAGGHAGSSTPSGRAPGLRYALAIAPVVEGRITIINAR